MIPTTTTIPVRVHRRRKWQLRRDTRALARDAINAALRRRDEGVIRSALRRQDWDAYAMAQLEYWSRWQQ